MGAGGPGLIFGGGPITPEQREEFYNRMAERQLERVTRLYELNDSQKVQMQARMEQLKEEQRQYTEPRLQEFETIRSEMRNLWQQSRQNGQFDGQRMRELGQQMRTMMEGAPLLNMDRVADEAERILPPEQVEQGRARRQTESVEFQRRREEMRQRFEQRRQEQETQPPAEQPENQETPNTGDGQPSNEGRESRRERGRRFRQSEGQDQPGGEQPREQGEGRRGDREGREGREGEARDYDPEAALGPWERYVRQYIRRYRLDPSQQATAMSILRGIQEQRTVYETAHRADYEIAQKLESTDQKKQELARLNSRVERLFVDLKTQLDRIPTVAQREAVEGRRVTTRPAEATTLPAGTSTRPSQGTADAEANRSERDRADREQTDRPRGERQRPAGRDRVRSERRQ